MTNVGIRPWRNPGRSQTTRRVLALEHRRLDDEIGRLVHAVAASKDAEALIVACEPAFPDDVEDHCMALEDAGERVFRRRMGRLVASALLFAVAATSFAVFHRLGRFPLVRFSVLAMVPTATFLAVSLGPSFGILRDRMNGVHDRRRDRDVESLARRSRIHVPPYALYADRMVSIDNVAIRLVPTDVVRREGERVAIEDRNGNVRAVLVRPSVHDAAGRHVDLDAADEILRRMRLL